jgi:hypothetical protein
MKPLIIVLALAAGCATLDAGSRARDQLSDAAREDFRRCQQALVDRQCGANSATAGDDALGAVFAGPAGAQAVCVNGLLSKYAAATDRKAWLVSNGCPRDMVGEDELDAP